MSLEVMVWVFKHSEAKGGRRLVLLALAEYAHDDGSTAFPSIETIERRTRMTRRGVQKALRELEADGAIQRTGETPFGTGVYTVVMGGANKTTSGGANDVRGGGEQNDAKGANVVRPNQLQEPSYKKETSLREETSVAETATFVSQVWTYWIETMGKRSNYKLDPTRRRILKRALEVRSVDECKRAIDGLKASPFHNGRNERGATYLELRHALAPTQTGQSVEDKIDSMIGLGKQANGALDDDWAAQLDTYMAKAEAEQRGAE